MLKQTIIKIAIGATIIGTGVLTYKVVKRKKNVAEEVQTEEA